MTVPRGFGLSERQLQLARQWWTELPDEVKGRATIWAILAMYGEYARKSLKEGFESEEVVHAGEQTAGGNAVGGKAD
jgi:hypothetical protein